MPEPVFCEQRIQQLVDEMLNVYPDLYPFEDTLHSLELWLQRKVSGDDLIPHSVDFYQTEIYCFEEAFKRIHNVARQVYNT